MIITVADTFEQRACVRFCVKFGRSATEMLEMLPRAFDEYSLG